MDYSQRSQGGGPGPSIVAERLNVLRHKLGNPANQQLLLNALAARAAKQAQEYGDVNPKTPGAQLRQQPPHTLATQPASSTPSHGQRTQPPAVPSLHPSRKRTASELYSQLAPSQVHPPTSELSQELSHDPELRAMNDRMGALRRKLVYHQQRAAEVAEGMRRLQADMDAWTAACLHAATNKARAEQVAGQVLLEQRAAALLARAAPVPEAVLQQVGGAAPGTDLLALADKIEAAIQKLSHTGQGAACPEILSGLSAIMGRAPEGAPAVGLSAPAASQTLVAIAALLDKMGAKDLVYTSSGSAATAAFGQPV